jgi:hypothetical protein
MNALGYTPIERWERGYVETIEDFAQDVFSAITTLAPSGRVEEPVSVRAIIGHPHAATS